MKVKSLLLSMCAIAALASCSQNDDEITGGSNAPEAKVTIKFAGSGAVSRAGTAIGENDAVVNTLTAFFFNSSGALIKTAINVDLNKVTAQKTVDLETTTDATQVILVANVSTDIKTGVTTIAQLKKVVISSLGTTSGENTPINQTATSLAMCGWGAINTDVEPRTAAVQLHFIAAKISKIKFVFTDVTSQGKYSSDEAGLANDVTGWFTIKRAYLMTAQTQSTLIPSGATTALWKGTFGPETGFVYTGGVKWGTGDWKPVTGKENYKLSNDYLNAPSTMPTTATGEIGNVLAKPMYVFENNSTEPTAVVVEALCNIKVEGVVQKLPRYFTVYFGEKKAQDNFDIIHGGQDYTITLTAKNSFDPDKGTGGGGTPDPTKPSVPADVTVTVTPAAWTPNATISKDFN